ncbi:MAG: hypothetical protein IK065_00375 [Neisseriaceae bacterium]|nr:hypothetical protein [Neisseriaceae bacterium]
MKRMKPIDIEEELIKDELNDSLYDLKTILKKDGFASAYIDREKSDDELVEKDNVEILNVSYFDHFLSNDEFLQENFTCYSMAQDATLSIKKEIENVINNFILFYDKLFTLNNGIIYSAHEKVEKIDNIDTYYQLVVNGMKERPLADLLFVNINTFAIFGFDLTHYIYVKNNKKISEEIRMIAKSCNLNII